MTFWYGCVMTDVAGGTKFQLRCSREELEVWRVQAARLGWPLSVWIRRALGEAVAFERAVEAEVIPPGDLVKLKPDPRRR